MSKQLTIQQWFARAVAAGIMPDDENILASSMLGNKWQLEMWNGNNPKECDFKLITAFCESDPLEPSEIQLRKDGVDRVELWTTEDIPTEKNIGEMCWLLHDGNISLTKLTDLWNEMECNNEVMYHSTNIDSCLNSDEYKILLATNGNIAPKPEDFKKVYGEI